MYMLLLSTSLANINNDTIRVQYESMIWTALIRDKWNVLEAHQSIYKYILAYLRVPGNQNHPLSEKTMVQNLLSILCLSKKESWISAAQSLRTRQLDTLNPLTVYEVLNTLFRMNHILITVKPDVVESELPQDLQRHGQTRNSPSEKHSPATPRNTPRGPKTERVRNQKEDKTVNDAWLYSINKRRTISERGYYPPCTNPNPATTY
jgi:hypothetical protein